MIQRNALPIAVFLLALWLLLNSAGDKPVDDTWSIVIAIAAGALAVVAFRR